MSKTYIPAGYRPTMTLYDTQDAIALIKRNFQDSLARALRLKRVTAPLFVVPESGLNDNLNGVEPACALRYPQRGLRRGGGAFPGQVEAYGPLPV